MKYVDYDLAMEYLGENDNLFHLVSKSFLTSYQDYELRLKKLVSKEDFLELFHEIHNLKGITLNFGAKALYSQSLKILDEMRKSHYEHTTFQDYLRCFNETYKELSLIEVK